MRTLLQKHSRYVSVCPDDTGHQMTESFPGIQSRGQRLRGFHWQILWQVGGRTLGSGSWSLATRLGGRTLTLSPRSSRGMYYTGWISMTGFGSGCAFMCTSVDTARLLDTWSISASQSPALTAADIRDLQAVVRRRVCGSKCQLTESKRNFGTVGKSTWNVLPDILRCSTHSVYFQVSSKTFLLLLSLAMLQLQLIDYTNYLLRAGHARTERMYRCVII